MNASDAEHIYLSRPISNRMKHADFLLYYEEDVSDLNDVVLRSLAFDRLPALSSGPCTIHVLVNGFSVLETGKRSYQLFETFERVTTRDNLAAWANFARGYWTTKVPTEVGHYFVKDLDLGKRSSRELIRVGQRLLDVSGGAVRPGRVTEFLGLWWSVRTPSLPGSY